jgi:Flp pilus assembly pilin Flp
MSELRGLQKARSGSAAVEYGLIAAATALALIAILPSIVAALSATLN